VFLKAELVLLAIEPWFGSGIHVPMMPLPDAVVVILAVATWLDASCQVGDQGIACQWSHRLPPLVGLGWPGDGLAGGVAAHAMATLA
jgi:hypothetical protein